MNTFSMLHSLLRVLAPAAALVLVLVLVLAGCSVGPDYRQPSAPAPAAAYKEAGPWKPARPSDDAIRGPWWEMFHDSRLNALEAQVAISNQNVLQYEAQFREAVAAVTVARSGLFPTVTTSPTFRETGSGVGGSGSGGGGGTTITADGTVINSGGGGRGGSSSSTRYEWPVDVTYLVDIWGQVRRELEENKATAQASLADLENARLSYQATLAQDYFSLRGLDAEKQLLTETVASYEKYLDLTKNRYAAGIASEADVAQAQTQLDTTRTSLVDLGVARAQYEHAIAVLVGQPASRFALPDSPLVVEPPRIPYGVPSRLLERRPDIAAAERRMASANAAVGVQVAAFYPSITLSGSAGVESVELAQLFSGPSFFWSVGPAVAQTIFDAGAIHGQAEEARANYDATVAAYRQAVLAAFQQVEDGLAGLRILEQEAQTAARAAASAQKSLEIATNQYRAGTQDYLNVITAQATALNDQITLLNVGTRRMTTSVQLVEALGGGWDAARFPGPDQVEAAAAATHPPVK